MLVNVLKEIIELGCKKRAIQIEKQWPQVEFKLQYNGRYYTNQKSNIIKGKIQHDKTFAAAAAIPTAINLKKIQI
jgi:hypothetical protein